MQIYAYDRGESKRFRYMVIYTIGKQWCSFAAAADGSSWVSGKITRNRPKAPKNATSVGYANLPPAVSRAVAYDIRERMSKAAGDIKGAKSSVG